MSADESTGRIKHALYTSARDQASGLPTAFRQSAVPVVAMDYVDNMRGHLFCPVCLTGLTRTPKDKPYFSNGRRACFAHLPSNRDIPCDLRTPKPEGKLYLTEEEAARAVANDELVIVNSFLESEPQSPPSVGEYDQSAVEDRSGPIADVPIARHDGKTFRLPTRITAVSTICRRFDLNLYRYYVFPGSKSALRLVDALMNIATVTEPIATPALYFGRIVSSFNAGHNPKPTNIRMTQLQCHAAIKDFYIKAIDRLQADKGISDASAGRYVLFWSPIANSGLGLAANNLGWGKFALLPEKYESLLAVVGA
jgi:hypothetical protein